MKTRTAGVVLVFVMAVGSSTSPVSAQDVVLPPLAAIHDASLVRRVEGAVHAALLATDGQERDAHLAVAEQLGRHLVAADSMSADAHYWLAVALGVKTEYSGPFQKLTSGREVFFTTARILELDPDHAGGHEMMGRLHAAVMRLPWVVRSLALRMGMGKALGEASWEAAEGHYRRAMELDGAAIAPRLELAKLFVQQERALEARPVLASLSSIPARSRVDELMLDEADRILSGLGGPLPTDEP